MRHGSVAVVAAGLAAGSSLVLACFAGRFDLACSGFEASQPAVVPASWLVVAVDSFDLAFFVANLASVLEIGHEQPFGQLGAAASLTLAAAAGGSFAGRLWVEPQACSSLEYPECCRVVDWPG